MQLSFRTCRLLFAAGLSAAAAGAQVTTRISVLPSGVQTRYSSRLARISADGRFVAFVSLSPSLVPGDTNGAWDVFVRDLQLGLTTRASVDSSGVQGNQDSGIGDPLAPPISADGRFVAFSSLASNLVPGDTNGVDDVFVRDLRNGTTERVSVATSGAQGNGRSSAPSISADGRYVSFTSDASNLVPGDANGRRDVFVRDRISGTTIRVSVDSSGAEGNQDSFAGSISADGRHVAFMSDATNLVAGDTNGWTDIFVHDLATGATDRVSVDSSGGQADQNSYNPSITGDGRFVAFESDARNLVGSDTNGARDIFVHDRLSGANERASVSSSGIEGDDFSFFSTISADGRYVTYASFASNLVPHDTNGDEDGFLHDRQTGATVRVSVGTNDRQANGASGMPGLSADGRWAAYESNAADLVPGDTNMRPDIFLTDLAPAGFRSLCDPGSAGVIGCPCSNPPGGSGQGCDNSAATGGAVLSASGIGYLSLDSLVFTTSGERSTATSIVLQGNALASGGIVYGQGVRCVGGTLKRLFTKSAVGGSITAPDFSAGDPTVSARSAAAGDVIQGGQSRWYLVYYRDPNVLGGCPASSTFNATQTGRIDWLP